MPPSHSVSGGWSCRSRVCPDRSRRHSKHRVTHTPPQPPPPPLCDSGKRASSSAMCASQRRCLSLRRLGRSAILHRYTLSLSSSRSVPRVRCECLASGAAGRSEQRSVARLPLSCSRLAAGTPRRGSYGLLGSGSSCSCPTKAVLQRMKGSAPVGPDDQAVLLVEYVIARQVIQHHRVVLVVVFRKFCPQQRQRLAVKQPCVGRHRLTASLFAGGA